MATEWRQLAASSRGRPEQERAIWSHKLLRWPSAAPSAAPPGCSGAVTTGRLVDLDQTF